MAKNLEAVRKECEVSAEQTRILDGHQKPILLLDKKKEAKILCPSVAPGNPKLGNAPICPGSASDLPI